MHHGLLLTLILISLSCNNYSALKERDEIQERTAIPDQPLGELISDLKVDKKDISILIDKSDYTLQIVANNMTIKSYPVVFGPNPIDDKRREGDKCTPEGKFTIRDLYPHDKWSKFLWVDYPNEESWKKHNAAKTNGELDNDATIGGEIGIHGVPNNDESLIDEKINWTLGCISLKNKHIDEIYNYVTKGTVIIIQK